MTLPMYYRSRIYFHLLPLSKLGFDCFGRYWPPGKKVYQYRRDADTLHIRADSHEEALTRLFKVLTARSELRHGLQHEQGRE